MSYLSDKDTLYLFNKRYQLRLKNKKLYIYLDQEKIDEIPFFRLTGLVLNYHIPVESKIFQYTFTHNITVCFVDGRFNFIGSIKHPESKNIFLRKFQYTTTHTPEEKLSLAKTIITGKLLNQAQVLQWRSGQKAKIQNDIEKIQNLDSLRGVEGSFATVYWREFGNRIKNPDFTWHGRFHYPARDPVNALLSWGYTLLGIEIQTFLEIIGLDPYLGFFHTDYYGRPSLVCDMQEEFRPWVVDKFVLRLINKKQIRKEHFKEQNGEYRLQGEGYQIFQQEWLHQMKVDKKYKMISETDLAIRGVIETQMRLLSKHMTQELQFRPFLV